jgi:hypothetical protein
LLNASTSWTRGCSANASPLVAVAEGWVTSVSLPAAPVVAVAVKTTGEPGTPEAEATVLCSPAVGPSVRRIPARPSTPVPTAGAVTLPPLSAVQETPKPSTGLPAASVARTTSDSASVVPTGAV